MDITHNMFSYTEIAFVERTRNFPAKVPGRCEHHPTRNKKTIKDHTPQIVGPNCLSLKHPDAIKSCVKKDNYTIKLTTTNV